MSKHTSPLIMIAAFLMGIGLFAIFDPIFLKLFAQTRPWIRDQSYLLIGGVILLILSFMLFRISASRNEHK